MNKHKEKPESRALLILLLTMAAAGLGGYAVGRIAAGVDRNAILDFGDSLVPALVRLLPALQIGVNAVLLALSAVNLRRARLAEKRGAEDENEYMEAERLLSRPMLCANAAMVLNLLVPSLMLELVLYGAVEKTQAAAFLAVVISLFVLSLAWTITVQYLAVKAEKRMNPEKRGSVFEFRFRKKWTDSCDEMEKLAMYKAGYRAFTVTSRACMTLWILSLPAQILFRTGFFPALCICLIYAVMVLSYSVECVRLEKNDRQR